MKFTNSLIFIFRWDDVMDFLKNRPPSKDQFAEAVIAEFRRAGDPRELKYDQENFRLKHSTGEEMNLTSLFQEHCQLPPPPLASSSRAGTRGPSAADWNRSKRSRR